jgi:formyl-CoA transferase
VGPVQDAREIYECPHVEARHVLIDVPDPVLGSVRLVGPPFKMSGVPEPLTGAAPRLGEHSAEILREMLGYTDQQVTALQAEGVL